MQSTAVNSSAMRPTKLEGLPLSQVSSLAQASLSLGANLLDQQSTVIESTLSRYLASSSLKSYFDVTQSYVAKKLLQIVVPFRRFSSEERDLMSPDLYIPMMSFVTYALACGYMTGTFEMVGVSASTGLLLLFLEAVVVKGLLFATAIDTAPFLEILSQSACKFVGLVIACSLRVIGTQVYAASLFYLSVSMMMWMMRSFKRKWLIEHNVETSKSKSYFLLFIGVLQIPLMFILGTQSAASQVV